MVGGVGWRGELIDGNQQHCVGPRPKGHNLASGSGAPCPPPDRPPLNSGSPRRLLIADFRRRQLPTDSPLGVTGSPGTVSAARKKKLVGESASVCFSPVLPSASLTTSLSPALPLSLRPISPDLAQSGRPCRVPVRPAARAEGHFRRSSVGAAASRPALETSRPSADRSLSENWTPQRLGHGG